MTCKYCGEQIAEGAKFCENCGNKVEEETVINDVFETETKEEYKEPERVEAEIVGEDAPKSESFESTSATEEVKADKKTSGDGPIGYSIASLVCGILGLLCCCCGFFGFILSAAGITLGIISINKNCEGKGMAIAGIACGGVGALVCIIGIIASAATGSLMDPSNVQNQVEDFLDSL